MFTVLRGLVHVLEERRFCSSGLMEIIDGIESVFPLQDLACVACSANRSTQCEMENSKITGIIGAECFIKLALRYELKFLLKAVFSAICC